MSTITMDRKKSIGGSDAAVVLGISPWKSPLELYLEKIGELPPVDETEAMQWGSLLEDPIAQEFSRRTGRKVARVNRELAHRDYPFVTGHIDRRIVGEDRILEIKTTNVFAREWGEEGTDQVPEHYLAQVQHYLAVTGYHAADVAVLVGGQQLRLYVVERHEGLISTLLQAELDFWWGHVEKRIPPEPRTSAEASALWRTAVGRSVEADAGILAVYHQLLLVRQTIAHHEKKKDECELILKTAMQDAERIVHGDEVLVDWKEVTARRFDQKALAAEHPELAAKFTHPNTYRRFVVKELGK